MNICLGIVNGFTSEMIVHDLSRDAYKQVRLHIDSCTTGIDKPWYSISDAESTYNP